MKIAYILGIFPKLSESFILNEIIELSNKGVEISIYSMLKPNEKIIHDEFNYNKIFDNTFYFDIDLKYIINNPEILMYFVKECLHDTFEFNIDKATIINNLKLAYFATLLKSKEVDLIHSHFTSDFARKLGRMTGLNFTVTNHAVEIFRNPKIKKLRRSFDAAQLIFTPSYYNKKYLAAELRCDESKIRVIRATISPTKFKRTKPPSDEHIIMTGRLVEKKGMKYMIFAMKNIIEKHPTVLLKIIGEGPLEKELKQLVKQENVESNVKFMGSLSDIEYYTELENSIIAVLPCLITEDGDRDVCPLTLQEAMSMELPVVSTNVHSIPELVEDGVSGILVSPNNEEEISAAILELLDNPQLQQEMGRKSRIKIEKEFDISLQTKKQMSEWTKL